MIDAILEADRQVPRKQRHTAKRIFERLRDEHGFDGQCAIVKDSASSNLCCSEEFWRAGTHRAYAKSSH